MDQLTRAVARAIETSPASLRELARAAGLSHVHLLRLKRGTKPATPAAAAKIATALEQWGKRCSTSVRRIREASKRVRREK